MGIVSNENQNELLQNFGYATRVGWMGFSGFRATLKCSISVCFLTFLVWNNNSSLKLKRNFIIAAFALSLLGNMFYGRFGIIVSLVAIVVALLMYKKMTPLFFGKILFAIAIGFLALFCLKNYSKALNDWYIWMVTPFKNFISTFNAIYIFHFF